MLNDENVSVEMSKLESDLNNGMTNSEVEKKKKKKKVHFSDKNETIYYEKDESEHNSYFGVTFNNYNYFECFYSKLYNYNFDEKDGGLESPQCNGEEEDAEAASYFDFQDESHYGNPNESEVELEEESEESETAKGKNRKEEMKKEKGKETIQRMNLMRKENGIGIGMNTCIRQKNNNGEIVVPEGNVSEFQQSFNEDCSFEIKNIKKALLDAEEKTSNYNKEYFGYEIDPFNMKNELKEGYIDKFGNYIYNEEYDNDEIEEAWLKSVDEKDPLSTFSSERLRSKVHKEIYAKYDEDSKNTQDYYQTVNIYDALFSLCALLIEKETPLKAMVRYKTDLQACKKILAEYRKQIEQFSSAHPFLMNWHTGKKEQSNESFENKEKNLNVVQAKKNVVQVTIKKKEDLHEEIFSHEDNKRTSIDKKEEPQSSEEKDTREKVEEEKEETRKDQRRDTSNILKQETNEDSSEKTLESPNEESNEHHNEETDISGVEETNECENKKPDEAHKEETDNSRKEKISEPQDMEINETPKREFCESQVKETCKVVTTEVINNVTDNSEEKTNVELSDETSCREIVKSDEETNGENKCETIQATANEEVWREYQQMLGVYQKLELDYKTAERRFNNLIDLTQKLTYEYKNVYFLTKGEFEKLYKKLEEYKENIEIKWQFKWSNDSEDNAYGPYNYTDIYQWISVGYVSAINPIHLRRINTENEVVENIWQMYDAINYLIFVSNENVKKKKQLDEMKVKASNESRAIKNGTENVSVHMSTSESEEDDTKDEEEIEEQFDISNRKRKKKKGLIEISKKKAKINNKNFNNSKKEDDEFDEDEDEDEDDFDDYEF